VQSNAEVRSGTLRSGQILYDNSILINWDSTCSCFSCYFCRCSQLYVYYTMLLLLLELPMLQYLFKELTIFMSMLVLLLFYSSLVANIAKIQNILKCVTYKPYFINNVSVEVK